MNAMPLTSTAPTFVSRRTDRDWTSYAVVGVIALLVGLSIGALIQSREAGTSAASTTSAVAAALPRTASLRPEAHLYGSRPLDEAVAAPVAAVVVPLIREAHFVSGELRTRAAASRVAIPSAAEDASRPARELHFYGA